MSDGSNVPRGAVSTFSPRVRASRHESAIRFECHELDPARILWPPRRRGQLIAWFHAMVLRVADMRVWGFLHEPEFACDAERVKRGMLSSAVLVTAPTFQASVCSSPREYSAPRAGVGQLIVWLHATMLRTGVCRVPCMSQNSQRRAGRRRAGCFPAAFGASVLPCERWTDVSNDP
jgi:hypothetical protein